MKKQDQEKVHKDKVKESKDQKSSELKSPATPEQELLKFKKEAEEYKDKYVRLYAEFDNVRKRFDRDKMEFVKYANEGLLVEFLGIMDDLDRSVEAAHAQHEDYEAFLKGIEMVMVRIHELLKRNQVQAIESVGKKFDPHCHEILMQVESAEHEEGEVIEEFQKGYRYGDRVIRTSKVKLAMSPRVEKAEPENEESEVSAEADDLNN